MKSVFALFAVSLFLAPSVEAQNCNCNTVQSNVASTVTRTQTANIQTAANKTVAIKPSPTPPASKVVVPAKTPATKTVVQTVIKTPPGYEKTIAELRKDVKEAKEDAAAAKTRADEAYTLAGAADALAKKVEAATKPVVEGWESMVLFKTQTEVKVQEFGKVYGMDPYWVGWAVTIVFWLLVILLIVALISLIARAIRWGFRREPAYSI